MDHNIVTPETGHLELVKSITLLEVQEKELPVQDEKLLWK